MLSSITSKFRRKQLAATAAGAGAFAVPLPPLDSDDEPRYRPIEMWLVRRLLSMLAPFKWQYGAAVACGLVHVLLDMQSPQFIQRIADYVTAYRQNPGATPQSAAVRHLLLVMLAWTLVFAGSVVLQRLTILLMTRAGESVQF